MDINKSSIIPNNKEFKDTIKKEEIDPNENK